MSINNGWINILRYIYSMDYYSAIKKEQNIDVYNNMMDLKIIILHRISQIPLPVPQKEYFLSYLIYVKLWNM